MNNEQMYYPYVNYNQQQYYQHPDYQQQYYQHPNYQPFEDTREIDDDVYRPDDAEDAPTSPPPAQPPSAPAAFSSPIQMGQIRSALCNCLGRWGFIGLRTPGPFGRDFWFYPTEVRKNGVVGYIWQGGRRRKVSYRYSQIRNFMCMS
ncbi:hypothetical protein NKR74_20420 [Bacillus sp. 3103sda1]|uniref:hypothetical protein n=1 Tax=Bacillus sp. 3103sda1 TaxID=2953808 RepID=UPI0020A06094|nr:hypothetical protein [Bacillus sp. 3103sda1]MCP1125659.1 hypothetical protein [Bacillus sp. 3103sda1]